MARVRKGSVVAEAWRNVDDGEPMPAWMNEVACWLHGGRFAVETQQGTRVAELGDWIVREEGGAACVFSDYAFRAFCEPLR
jgi:hypothetical protein